MHPRLTASVLLTLAMTMPCRIPICTNIMSLTLYSLLVFFFFLVHDRLCSPLISTSITNRATAIDTSLLLSCSTPRFKLVRTLHSKHSHYSNTTQSEPSSDRKTMMWEPRDGAAFLLGGGVIFIVKIATMDLLQLISKWLHETAWRDDDFPAVADCLNLGSFAEESPPRRHGRSPRGSPSHHHFGGDFPFRSSPPHHHAPYPPNGAAGLPPLHASPHQYSSSGPPHNNSNSILPGCHHQACTIKAYRRRHSTVLRTDTLHPINSNNNKEVLIDMLTNQPSYPGEPWMSPPARFPDYPPPPPPTRSSSWTFTAASTKFTATQETT